LSIFLGKVFDMGFLQKHFSGVDVSPLKEQQTRRRRRGVCSRRARATRRRRRPPARKKDAQGLSSTDLLSH
jgi:hypothetical protein